MKKYVLVMGGESDSALVIAKMKEQYGDEIIAITTEQAKERGLRTEDIANVPEMKIIAPPIMDVPFIGEYMSGQESRRDRRKRERKNRKLEGGNQ